MKKIVSIFWTIFLLLSNVFSLAGIKESFPNKSGEFVYFQDFTFTEETYIGFLYYNESTIGTRLLTINSEGNSSLEILFSLNPDVDYLELTGEKILSQTSNEDVNKINYIHDTFYELASHRKQANNQDYSSIKSITQDFPQYGGQVQIELNKAIPIFNFYSLTDIQGKTLLQVITIGTLSDNADKTFSKFNGFPEIQKQLKQKIIKPKQLSKKQIEKLNSEWQIQENVPGTMKLLGNNLLFWNFNFDIPDNKDDLTIFNYFSRNNRQSTDCTYVYFPSSIFTKKGNSLFCSYLSLTDNKYNQVYKVVTPKENTTYTMKMINCFSAWFYQNQNIVNYLLK